MTNVERNIVYNALGRVLKEWRNPSFQLSDDADFYRDMLSDARNIMYNQLGKKAVDMWDDDSYELYPKTVEGCLTDLGAVTDFMKRCVEGKAPETTGFDRMAIDILNRLQNFLDGQLSTDDETGRESEAAEG